MKNIYLIPTDKPNKLVKLFTNKLHLYEVILPIQDGEKYINIYITNNEEIKEGDISYYPPFGVGKNIIIDPDYIEGVLCFHIPAKNGKGSFTQKTSQTLDINKKIILTTDQDLIKDGVQSIPDEFLEWFVKNPTAEHVDVESEVKIYDKNDLCVSIKVFDTDYEKPMYYIVLKEDSIKTSDCGNVNCQSGVINGKTPKLCKKCNPKKEFKHIPYTGKVWEPPTKETLEEGINRIAMRDGYDIDGAKVADFTDGMVKGAKWQQERSYNEEEVLSLLRTGRYTNFNSMKTKEWFNQNKKK